MENNRTHIVHERTNEVQRTFGYRVVEDGSVLHVTVAEARCHPNDNFSKKAARSIVNTRLNSFEQGVREERTRTFTMDVHMRTPQDSRSWRELEKTISHMSDLRLPSPAALRQG